MAACITLNECRMPVDVGFLLVLMTTSPLGGGNVHHLHPCECKVGGMHGANTSINTVGRELQPRVTGPKVCFATLIPYMPNTTVCEPCKRCTRSKRSS